MIKPKVFVVQPSISTLWFFQRAPINGDKTRAEALHARVILVARRLVDAPLASVVGLDRLERNTAGLDTAIAAAFADLGIDKQAFGGILVGAAFA